MITYEFKTGTPEAWHEEIARFIAALENDPVVKGRISYRCMKAKQGTRYYHLAATADDDAAKALQANNDFAHYTEETKRVSGGTVQVVPLEIVAETAFRP
jgi:hypothetical protein